MEAGRCATVRQAVRHALSARQPAALEPALAEHIAGCAACRAALLATIAELFGVAVLPQAIGCERCMDDLPELVERELAGTLRNSIPDLAQVWWHLWTCAACAQTYDLTRDLLVAEQRGALQAFAPARLLQALNPPIQNLLRLTRQFLNRALPAPQAVMRGVDHGPSVLSEGNAHAGRFFTLSVLQQPNHDWQIEVLLTPPAKAWLILTLGENVYRARFDVQGSATIADVPAAIFAAPDGPDLTVGIESDEEHP